MPTFVKGGTTNTTPFGKNQFLRSPQDVKKESYTVAASTVPAQTINGAAGQKILQPGQVMAKITSGPEAGKVGPFQAGSGAAGAAAANEVQTVTVANATGGTFTLTFNGQTTAAIAYNATTGAVQAALEALTNIDPGDVVVSGSAGAYTLTFGGQYAGTDVAQVTATDSTTGAGHAVTVATTTPGAAAGVPTGGATDGRGDPNNIVGINTTFLPWQLIERDVEVAVAYDCQAVQAWCYESAADGTLLPLSNTTARAMLGLKRLSIHFS